MQQLGLDDAGAYYERLRGESADDEFRKLIHLVTITETCFLRDPAQFRLLRQHVIPSVLADRERDGTRAVRIWSAGCSSGEEPYSVALTLRDMGLHLTHPHWTFDILGTDLNTERLDAARRGEYGARAVRNVEGGLAAAVLRAVGRSVPAEGRHQAVRAIPGGQPHERSLDGRAAGRRRHHRVQERRDLLPCRGRRGGSSSGCTTRSTTAAICCSDTRSRCGRWSPGSRSSSTTASSAIARTRENEDRAPSRPRCRRSPSSPRVSTNAVSRRFARVRGTRRKPRCAS